MTDGQPAKARRGDGGHRANACVEDGPAGQLSDCQRFPGSSMAACRTRRWFGHRLLTFDHRLSTINAQQIHPSRPCLTCPSHARGERRASASPGTTAGTARSSQASNREPPLRRRTSRSRSAPLPSRRQPSARPERTRVDPTRPSFILPNSKPRRRREVAPPSPLTLRRVARPEDGVGGRSRNRVTRLVLRRYVDPCRGDAAMR